MKFLTYAFSIFCLCLQIGFALPKQHLIVDTDMNIDDVMAILYLLQNPSVSVDAITIAATGQAHCQPALKNLHNLLALTKKTILIACGRLHPLRFNHEFLAEYRQSADSLMNSAGLLPQTKTNKKDVKALSLLKSVLKKSIAPIDILAIGPLTNLADLMKNAPELKKKIHQIIIMGGAINVRGNVDNVSHNHYAEWNIYIDPLATKIVLSSGIQILLVPLDLTNQMPIDANFIDQLNKIHLTPAASYLNQVLQRNKKDFLHQWFFWDPLAAVIATHERLVTEKKQRITVLLQPESQSGRLLPSSTGSQVTIATGINKKRFQEILLKVINSAN